MYESCLSAVVRLHSRLSLTVDKVTDNDVTLNLFYNPSVNDPGRIGNLKWSYTNINQDDEKTLSSITEVSNSNYGGGYTITLSRPKDKDYQLAVNSVDLGTTAGPVIITAPPKPPPKPFLIQGHSGVLIWAQNDFLVTFSGDSAPQNGPNVGRSYHYSFTGQFISKNKVTGKETVLEKTTACSVDYDVGIDVFGDNSIRMTEDLNAPGNPCGISDSDKHHVNTFQIAP